MKIRPFLLRDNAAFTLIEIALALGLVGFALVGIVGAIPLAMNNSRLSIAQSRAASVANTIFSGIRAQTFSKVQFLEDAATATTPSGNGAVNLNLMVTTPSTSSLPNNPKVDATPVDPNAPLLFYAYFDEVPSMAPDSSTVDSRRLHFVSTPPSNTTFYKVVLRFNNNPPGTFAPYQPTPTAAPASHAQANAIEADICEADRPNDVFRFSSTIANRAE